MGFFKKLFAKQGHTPTFDGPPISGGNGSTPRAAVVLNCASMSTADHLIDRYLTEQLGEKGRDWRRTIEFFVNDDGIAPYTIKAIGVDTQNTNSLTYYFDVTRAMKATMNVAEAFLNKS